KAREQEEKGAIATARARAEAEARAESVERVRAQADQCAITLAGERARAEALALEAERGKIEAARAALGAAEARVRSQAERRSLADAHRRSAVELAELRSKLRALWAAGVGRRAATALRYGAIAVAVAGIAYASLWTAQAPPASVAGTPSLRLDYELRLGNRP
ncbi:MAG: hypothetical protein ABI789_10370, partial [Usitatibacter sp.]